MIETDRARQRQSERFLRAQIGTRRGRLLAGTLCAVGSTGGQILYYYALAGIAQGIVIHRQAALSLGGWFFAGVLGLITRLAFTYGAERVITHAASDILNDLRGTLLRHIFDPNGTMLPLEPAVTTGVILEQVDRLELYYSRYFPQRYRAVLVPLVLLAAIFPVNWVVGLLLLVLAPLIPLTMAVAGIGAEKLSRRQVVSLRYLSSYFLDRLQGIATIRRLGAGERELARIASISDDLRRRTMGILRVAFLSSAVLELVSGLAIALVAGYVALAMLRVWTFGVGSQGLSLQHGLFLVLLAPAFFQPLRSFAAAYHDRADALAAAWDLLPPASPATVLPVRPPAPSAAGDLELNEVTVRYAGRDQPALDRINLAIPAGALLAVLGPSGSGKTTLLGVIAGQVAPTAGEVMVGGMSLPDFDPVSWRRQVTWVGQRPYLFPGTIADNIALSRPGISPADVELAAERAGVTVFTAPLPLGLETMIGERGANLSAGQAQRVALARAFAGAAPLIVLDEPTAHLDAEAESAVIITILELAVGRTVLIATHSDALAARCRHTVRLDAGVATELLHA